MPANKLSTNELLDRYLSGAITAPQEAELERRAVTDPVLAEALEGVYAFPEADHTERVAQMVARTQVQGKGQEAKVRPLGRYLAAASILLLLAVAVFLLPRFANQPTADLAMKQAQPAVVATAPDDAETSVGGLNESAYAELEADVSPEPPPQVVSPDPANEQAVVTPPAPAPITQTEESAALIPKPAASPEPLADEATASQATPPAISAGGAEIDQIQAPSPTAVEPLAREAVKFSTPEGPQGAVTDNLEQAAGKRQRTTDNGQPTTVSGRITDEGGDPIIGALVRLPGLPIGERTDTNGVFRLDIDATTSQIDITHPDYEDESFDIRNQLDDIQLSLDDKEKKDYRAWTDSWAAVKVPLNNEPSYALPEEGYGNLRQRIEDNKPEGVPAGKVKLSFTVNLDGTMGDFVFKGRPSQETMDYVGGTIARTSIWKVVKGDKPVRVYFKVVFE